MSEQQSKDERLDALRQLALQPTQSRENFELLMWAVHQIEDSTKEPFYCPAGHRHSTPDERDQCERRSSKEWATRARFERIKAEMPEGIPGYSEFRFDWMHDALRELIDYCDALHADEPAALPQYELFVQARDLLCKIAGETDASRMEVNAWEAMELSRKMRDAAMVDLNPWLKRRTDGTAEPPSVTPSNPMVEASLHHITAALLSLSNARCVALGQTKSAVRENDAQCNGNCFLVGGPFVAEDPSCPKHGNH